MRHPRLMPPTLRVRPTLVKHDDVLADVNGSFNAISVFGHALGHALFYGRGAGQMPTASAVVADLVNVALNKSNLDIFRTFVILFAIVLMAAVVNWMVGRSFNQPLTRVRFWRRRAQAQNDLESATRLSSPRALGSKPGRPAKPG